MRVCTAATASCPMRCCWSSHSASSRARSALSCGSGGRGTWNASRSLGWRWPVPGRRRVPAGDGAQPVDRRHAVGHRGNAGVVGGRADLVRVRVHADPGRGRDRDPASPAVQHRRHRQPALVYGGLTATSQWSTSPACSVSVRSYAWLRARSAAPWPSPRRRWPSPHCSPAAPGDAGADRPPLLPPPVRRAAGGDSVRGPRVRRGRPGGARHRPRRHRHHDDPTVDRLAVGEAVTPGRYSPIGTVMARRQADAPGRRGSEAAAQQRRGGSHQRRADRLRGRQPRRGGVARSGGRRHACRRQRVGGGSADRGT
jgi:hypothetical protein